LGERGGLLYPGVREGLAQLKEKYPLFIVSNCQSGYIETFILGRSGTGQFPGLHRQSPLTAGSAERGKCVGLSTGLPGAAALAAAFFAVAGAVFAAAGAVVAFGRRLRAIVVHRSLLVLICALALHKG
jgi:hypothetical protein